MLRLTDYNRPQMVSNSNTDTKSNKKNKNLYKEMKTKEQEKIYLRFMNSEIRYVERSSKSKERKKVMRRNG